MAGILGTQGNAKIATWDLRIITSDYPRNRTDEPTFLLEDIRLGSCLGDGEDC